MSDALNKPLTLQELPELRRKTEAVSRFLKQQIGGHLETLRPLLAPERLFGKYAGGKSEVTAAERALEELKRNYKGFTRKPYDLSDSFDTSWLGLVGSSLELHPWEYTHEIQGKPITMNSPLRWVINYRTNYNLIQVKNALAGKETARPEYLRLFVVNALVMQLLLAQSQGLVQLFADLRYELKTESPADLFGLPVVTITSSLPSFRPSDDMIMAATAFSGVPAFIELIDLDAAKAPRDVLKERLEELLK
ncbi:MAG TPA: hypothetical protein VNV43_12535 [Candidatus Acidoferrales bacterium]|jgi:hypothetical protein|nr:hypothetical protein [Candidatus Acidoferrales bacterium]